MTTSTQWQLAHRAAERYASVLVPAILGPAARALVTWSTLREGDFVVDVGCGSGAATLAAADRVGRTGRVIGVDVNPGMLAVARGNVLPKDVHVEWREHSAYALPLDDRVADAVFAAQLLQFLDDRPRGMAEMRRVLKHRGRVYVSAWCGLDLNPYFEALVQAIRAELGPDTAAGLNAAFSLPSQAELQSLLAQAQFSDIRVVARRMDLSLPAPAVFVPRHIGATPLAQAFDGAPVTVQQAIVGHVTDALASYVERTGLRVPFTTHLASAIC